LCYTYLFKNMNINSKDSFKSLKKLEVD